MQTSGTHETDDRNYYAFFHSEINFIRYKNL